MVKLFAQYKRACESLGRSSFREFFRREQNLESSLVDEKASINEIREKRLTAGKQSSVENDENRSVELKPQINGHIPGKEIL